MDEKNGSLTSSGARPSTNRVTRHRADSVDTHSARQRALETLRYEASMVLGALRVLRAPVCQSRLVENAVTESAVIHIRSLCQVLLNDDPTRRDIIGLASLFSGYSDSANYRDLKEAVQQLRIACGEGPGSPLYNLARRITSLGGDYRLYVDAIEKLEPKIRKVLHEIVRLIPDAEIEPMP